MKQLLLIDANSIIHRSFHALPPFTSPAGQPTGALYGIASILIKLFKDDRPEYVAALFDRPEPTFREKIYAAYKAQRPPAAEDLVSQIIEAPNLFHAFGVMTFELAGFEADDLIATFTEKFKKENGLRVVILTGDRDTLQLVSGDRVVVKSFNKGVSDTTIYDEAGVIAKYGLKPSQMVDYKALAGDPSDNIKGVPGVGPKTATELIKKFGTIENLYDYVTGDPRTHLGNSPDGEDPRPSPSFSASKRDSLLERHLHSSSGAPASRSKSPEDDRRPIFEMNSKLVKRLGSFRKDAELSKELVILDRNVPLSVPALGELALPENPAVEAYFTSMGFASLMRRIDMKGKKTKKELTKTPSRQQPMF